MSPSSYHSGLKWLYIDFNSYFASVEQQLNPKLRGKPVAVVPVETDFTSAIAASYEAKAFGVKTGTMIKDAKRMCPGLICVLATHERYIEFHNRIIAEVNNHIPVSAVCSIDELACELMDNESSPEQVLKIANAIKKGIAANIGEYVKCSIGVAPNKYLAKIATDINKPNGFTIIAPSDIPAKLLPLKLRDLPGIGYNMEVRLSKVGIKTIADIWSKNPQQLKKAWGNIWGERMWYLLRGEEVKEEKSEKRSIGHSHVLTPELRPPAKAKFVARRLTLKTASRLRRLGFHSSALHLSTRLESGVRLEGSLQCYRAQDSITFAKMMEDIWQQLEPKMKGQRVKKISITLFQLTDITKTQPELFDSMPTDLDAQRRKYESLSNAMDKLNHKYGRDTIQLGMLASQGKGFTGTKIAFTRIPDMEEFLE